MRAAPRPPHAPRPPASRACLQKVAGGVAAEAADLGHRAAAHAAGDGVQQQRLVVLRSLGGGWGGTNEGRVWGWHAGGLAVRQRRRGGRCEGERGHPRASKPQEARVLQQAASCRGRPETRGRNRRDGSSGGGGGGEAHLHGADGALRGALHQVAQVVLALRVAPAAWLRPRLPRLPRPRVRQVRLRVLRAARAGARLVRRVLRQRAKGQRVGAGVAVRCAAARRQRPSFLPSGPVRGRGLQQGGRALAVP